MMHANDGQTTPKTQQITTMTGLIETRNGWQFLTEKGETERALYCALEHIRQLSELVYQYVPVSAAFPTVCNAKRFIAEVEGKS